MRRGATQRWLVSIGAAAGLLVWLYDYDFFLNAGGPAAPISNALLRATHLQGAAYPMPVLVPLLVMILSGAAAGAVIAIVVNRSSH